MIQVYADDKLVFDSRLEAYDLDGLKITTGINTGGTAEISMPPGHPAYDYFVEYRTIVTIYRDGELRFRGRALYPADNVYGQRTITCEGERCLLRDGVSRPYKYNHTPARIFTDVVTEFNAQVEQWKRFEVGEITVTDPNGAIEFESKEAEKTMATIDKLVQRCGGRIVFTTTTTGARAINWYAALNQRSGQTIELGENLLDFSSTGANTKELATGLIPYGARDEETGERLTIAVVNDGKDYLLADDAIDVRGTIMDTVTWDDATSPAALLAMAKEWLADRKLVIKSLQLTALDLSYLDKSLDSFEAGDYVRVISPPHGVDDDFQLTQMTEDLLNPDKSRITLGYDVASLTGADADAAKQTSAALTAVTTKAGGTYARASDLGRVEYELLQKIAELETKLSNL